MSRPERWFGPDQLPSIKHVIAATAIEKVDSSYSFDDIGKVATGECSAEDRQLELLDEEEGILVSVSAMARFAGMALNVTDDDADGRERRLVAQKRVKRPTALSCSPWPWPAHVLCSRKQF